MLRSYTLSASGADTTVWFMKEQDVVISVRSFYQQAPATEYIEALEPAVLLYITYDQLEETYTRFPEMNQVGRRLTEKYYMLAEERLEGIRNKCAAERYTFLLERHPEIFERASLGHIASYLDLNRDTLGRLRRQQLRG
jgi:CRP/FNR family transcriptional regulator, anaerobic regulatory protein